MKQRGEQIRANVVRQGSIKVQGASVWHDAGDIVCLYLTTESKHAECSGIMEYGDDSCLALRADVFTKNRHETESGHTLVAFPDFPEHEIWAWEGPGKNTVRVVLLKKDAKP